MSNYIGLNIKGIRQYWELSQDEFALLINATRGMVMQYENRGSMPKDETIETIVEVTGISKDMLVNTKIKRSEYPEMSMQLRLYIANYRDDPDSFNDLSKDDIRELMSATSETAAEKIIHKNPSNTKKEPENKESISYLQSDNINMSNSLETNGAPSTFENPDKPTGEISTMNSYLLHSLIEAQKDLAIAAKNNSVAAKDDARARLILAELLQSKEREGAPVDIGTK